MMQLVRMELIAKHNNSNFSLAERLEQNNFIFETKYVFLGAKILHYFICLSVYLSERNVISWLLFNIIFWYTSIKDKALVSNKKNLKTPPPTLFYKKKWKGKLLKRDNISRTNFNYW